MKPAADPAVKARQVLPGLTFQGEKQSMSNIETPTINEATGGAMNLNNHAPAAIYVHEAMSEEAFDALATSWDRASLGDLTYSHVEYLNSPSGLIVLAHHGDIAGQVDGIHPANLSHSIERPVNIIEPLADGDHQPFVNSPVPYNIHWMTRRSQGGLVLAAFGRMIDGGDEEAPCIKADDDGRFSVAIYDAPAGPVVGVFDFDADLVHVIHPALVPPELLEATR